MNPDYRPSYYYQPEVNFAKQEKLRKSQMYKKANQTHPAFKKKK